MNLWIKCCREDKNVFIFIQEKNLEVIKKIVLPYFDIRLNEIPSSIDWKIYLPARCKKMVDEKWKPVHQNIPGEIFYKRTFLYQRETKCIYIEEPNDEQLKIQTAVRLCRDIIKYQYDADNMLFLHAGMVRYKEKGICIMGEKKSGKTSSILALLSTVKSISYISNDDVSIAMKDSRIIGIGWPRAISVRKDSLVYMKNILYCYDFANVATHPDNRIEELSKYLYLYPDELKQIFGCDIYTENCLDMILFPKFSKSFKAIELTPSEIENCIKANLANNKSKYSGELREELIVEQKNYNSLIMALTNVRCFRVYQNINEMEKLGKWLESIYA